MNSIIFQNPISGCYILRLKNRITYIGESANVTARFSGHVDKIFDSIEIIPVEGDSDCRKELERTLIQEHNPPLNKAHRKRTGVKKPQCVRCGSEDVIKRICNACGSKDATPRIFKQVWDFSNGVHPIRSTKGVYLIDNKATGKVLKKLRKDHGVNQIALAKALGISGPALFCRESGRVELTSKWVEQYGKAVMKLKK